jgi:hypothetical protein
MEDFEVSVVYNTSCHLLYRCFKVVVIFCISVFYDYIILQILSHLFMHMLGIIFRMQSMKMHDLAKYEWSLFIEKKRM